MCGSSEKWEQPYSSKGAGFVPESKGADNQATGDVAGRGKREQLGEARKGFSSNSVSLQGQSSHVCVYCASVFSWLLFKLREVIDFPILECKMRS